MLFSFLNKREKKAEILSIWWFLVLALVGGAIVLGVIFNASAEVNVKQYESELMFKSLVDCISYRGVLKQEVLQDDFDLLSFCNFNEYFFETKDFSYLEISFSDSNKRIYIGNAAHREDCLISKNIENKKYPRCFFKEKGFYVENDGELKEIGLFLMAVSNQEGGVNSNEK